jgi:hypothetical protein
MSVQHETKQVGIVIYRQNTLYSLRQTPEGLLFTHISLYKSTYDVIETLTITNCRISQAICHQHIFQFLNILLKFSWIFVFLKSSVDVIFNWFENW